MTAKTARKDSKTKAKPALKKTRALEEKEAALNNRQRAFVEHYLACWNATKAAALAGYSSKTAQEQGSRLLSNVMVQEAVKSRIAELKMTADEVLLRLADHARGDMSDFLVVAGRGVRLDLKAAKKAGKLHLVRKYGKGKDGVKIELYDAQDAMVHIGRALKLFGERNEEIDLSKLSTEQLERLAQGENVYSVLAAAGESGTGTAPTT